MADTGFRLFSWGHLLLLLLLPVLAAVLGWWGRRNRVAACRIRLVLGWLLLADAVTWYAWNIAHGWFRFPGQLPLQISDLVTWVAIFAALTLNQWLFEIAYYIGFTTAYLTLITPDLYAPVWTYASIRFFIEHSGTVLIALYLVWSRLKRPRPGSWWRAFLVMNVYAAAIIAFNFDFGTNYFYVMTKPQQPTLLDYLGPWPFYLLVVDAVALAIFRLLAWFGDRLHNLAILK